MTKPKLLRVLHAILNRHGDYASQEVLEQTQSIIRLEMDEEERKGNMTLIKHPNGFPHTVDGKPWKEWDPEQPEEGGREIREYF